MANCYMIDHIHRGPFH